MELTLNLTKSIGEDDVPDIDIQTTGPGKLIATELRTIADQIDPPFLLPEKGPR